MSEMESNNTQSVASEAGICNNRCSWFRG